MKKLKSFFILLVLLSLVSFPVSSQSYYITDEQLTELENQSNKQKELIQNQKNQLNELNNQFQDQEKQLQDLEKQTDNLENQLNQAETSLKKSKTKSWIERILIAVCTFFSGLFIGLFVPGAFFNN